MDEKQNTKSKKKKQDRKRFRFWKFFLGFFLVLVCFAVLISLLLFKTQSGVRFIENRANAILNREDRPIRMEITGLSGSLPFDIRIKRFEARDAEGPFLDAEDLVLNLSFGSLLVKRIHIQEISGKHLALYRKPVLPPKEKDERESGKEFSIPSLPEILVDKLLLEEIFIGKSLVGEDTVLRLAGFLTNDSELLSATLSLTSLEGLSVALSLEAGFMHRTRVLDLKGYFSEKKGELTKLLKLPALPLSLDLHGNGEPGEWLGRLDFSAGEKNSLGTDLKIAWEKGWPSVEFKGKLALDPDLLPGTTDPFLTASDLEGHFFEDGKKNAYIATLNIQNDKIEVDLNAALFHKKGEVDADLILAIAKPEELSPTAAFYPGSEVLLEAKATGKIKEPEIHAELILAGPAFGGVHFKRLALRSDLGLKEELFGNRELHCKGSLEAEGLSLNKRTAPAPIHTDFDLVYALSDKKLLVNQLEITSKDLLAKAEGKVTQLNTVDAKLDFELDQLASWLALVMDSPVSGKGHASAELKGTFSPLVLEAKILSDLEDLQGFPDPVPGLVGKKLTLEGKAGIEETKSGDLTFAVVDLNVTSPTFRLTADGSFSRKKQNISLTTKADIPDLTPLFPKTGMKGGLDLQGKIKGKPENFSFDLALSSTDFSLKQTGVLPFLLSLSGDRKNTETAGKISFKTNTSRVPATLTSEFSLKGKTLQIPVLDANFPGLHLKGKGNANLEKPLITAEMTGLLEDAAKFGAIFGLSMKGKGNVTAKMSGSDKGQNLNLEALFSSLGLNEMTLERLEAKGSLGDLFGKKNVDATFLAKNFVAGDEVSIKESSGKITGDLAALSIVAKTEGEVFGPLQLELNGNYALKDQTQQVTLSKLGGTWSQTPFKLEKNWEVSIKNQGIFAGPLLFRLEEALLSASGSMEPRNLKFDIKLENFPAHLIPIGAKGKLQAELHAEGSPASPVIRLNFRGEKILPQDTANYTGPGVNSLIRAQFGGQSLSFDAKLWETREDNPFLTGTGSLPMLLSLQPFRFELSKEAPIKAALNGRASLDRLGIFFMPVTQLIRGDLQMDLALSGKLNRPVLAGNAVLENGSYQHLEHGVFLQNIRTRIRLSPETLEILELTAKDVNGGSLEGRGKLGLDPKDGLPFEASITTGAFQVMNSATILAVLKDMNMSFTGDMKRQELKGNINLDRVEYYIKDFGGPSVPELKVREIPPPEGEEKTQPQRKRPFSPRLDLAVNAPGKLFVRGRGLDSEWKGTLNIGGMALSPAIRGTIGLVRGRLDFLGKRLDLEEGQIVLDGSRPPNPYISVKAQQDGKEVLSILKITGQPSSLKFALSSEPPLPEDEVLSHMLFGRSISSISPLQAAQLAWAIGELSGYTEGSGYLFGMARDLLGLDDLNLVSDGDDPDDIRLRAGKYVHERVYLRVEKDLKTDDDLISADVELTDRLSFESKLGPKGGGVGLYWKRDF